MVLNIQGNPTEPETTIGRFGLEEKDPTVGINLPEGLINDYFKTVQSSQMVRILSYLKKHRQKNQ